ncbi:ion transporter [Haloferax sp. MBLA0076]|uniref:Ion transporter n=1 Tax=Haloferax litoreum TaxID=2666140 RepID=A0A6A8GL68_9EURY|nr:MULTISPECIES: potassium channel family protein [Haloferax]KAB1194625.1 potassium channel family protein [Haloferax sp. CBA1148]MRX23202.1 ion transporter [Haloferax litoreum]
MSSSTKRRTWRLVDPETKSRVGQRLQSVALVLASLNVVAVVLQSIDRLYDAAPLLFDGFAVVSVALFTLLFAVRIWAAATSRVYRGSDGRFRLVRQPFVLLDLVVIVVFWPTFFVYPETLGGIRVLWLARMFDIPRLDRSRTRFKRVLAAQRDDLGTAFIGAGTLVLLSSTLMFFAENGAQPEAFSSIPDALWWGVVTLTTVGYGDVVPVTPLGRLLGAITTFGGIAFFALPSSILAAGFFAEREQEHDVESAQDEPKTGPTRSSDDASQNRCPHCGESLDSAGPTNH